MTFVYIQLSKVDCFILFVVIILSHHINCLLETILCFISLVVHPYCFNQLFTGGVDQVGLLGQMLTSTVNTLMYTFEIAPVFTVMEAYILKKMREFVGWPNGDGDGIFTPGILSMK